MAIEGSVASLFESAARRGNIPDSQMTYLLSDFMGMSQEELMAYALPILHARRDDYYLEELMFDISKPDVLIGAESPSQVRNLGFRLPPYAMAGTVRDVQAVAAGGSFYNLGRISVDDVPNTVAQAWYFYGNYLVYQQNTIGSVAPPIALRCIVHVRPNQLVPDTTLFADISNDTFGLDQCCRIVQVAGDLKTVVVDRPVTVTNTYPIDNISGTPGYEVKNRNQLAVGGAPGTTIQFNSIPPTPYNAGDWLAPSGYTPVVPLPLEMHALLAQRIVVKFLEAQGEESQLEQARKSLTEMALQIPLLIQPRAEGKPKKLAPRLGLWRRWRW